MRDRDAVVDAAHRQHADRAAGAVHELDAVGQQRLDPVAVDRVRVPAADLHQLVGAARLHEAPESRRRAPTEIARRGTPRRTSSLAPLEGLPPSGPPGGSRYRRARAARRPARRYRPARCRPSRCARRRRRSVPGRVARVDRHDAHPRCRVAAGDAAARRARLPVRHSPSRRCSLDRARHAARPSPGRTRRPPRGAAGASRAPRARRCARGRSRRGSAPSRRRGVGAGAVAEQRDAHRAAHARHVDLTQAGWPRRAPPRLGRGSPGTRRTPSFGIIVFTSLRAVAHRGPGRRRHPMLAPDRRWSARPQRKRPKTSEPGIATLLPWPASNDSDRRLRTDALRHLPMRSSGHHSNRPARGSQLVRRYHPGAARDWEGRGMTSIEEGKEGGIDRAGWRGAGGVCWSERSRLRQPACWLWAPPARLRSRGRRRTRWTRRSRMAACHARAKFSVWRSRKVPRGAMTDPPGVRRWTWNRGRTTSPARRAPSAR